MSIKEARQAVGMTVKEVSLFLEIPVRTLQTWEAGTRVPPPYVEKLVVEKLQNLEVCEDMSRGKKTNEIHEAYLQCKEVFEPSLDLQLEFFNIQDDEERMFYEVLANFFMQRRQKELVEKGVF